MEHAELDRIIETLRQAAGDASTGQVRWKDLWDQIRHIGSSFKGIRYPTRQEHQAAWGRFQSIVEQIKDAESRWRAQAEDEASSLQLRVEQLERAAKEALEGRAGRSWADIWAQVRAVRDSFRDTRFPSRQRREVLWERLSQVAANLNSDRERRFLNSKTHMEDILNLAELSRPPSWFGEVLAAMITLPVHLAGQVLDDILGLDRAKLELERRSEILQRAWALLSDHKEEMSSADKQHVHAVLTSLREDLNRDWTEWKQARSTYSETRKQNFRERVEARVEKLQGHRERLSGVLEHKRGHLRELEEQRDTAYSDSFRDRVGQWIDEEESAIASIEEKVSKIEEHLAEARGKLDEID